MSTINSLNDAFTKGLEGYSNKLVTNSGGVKLWWEKNWRKFERIFIAEPLLSALKDLPVSLYLMSKARIGENGRAVPLSNGNGVQRDGLGLMLYTTFNATSKAAEQFAKKIIQDVPMLDGYVFVGSEAVKQAPNLAAITQHTTLDQNRASTSLRLEGCILIMAPSGSESSGQLWGYKGKTQSRKDVNQRTTANVDAEEIDLGNLA